MKLCFIFSMIEARKGRGGGASRRQKYFGVAGILAKSG